ncbi:hypothetical protein HDK90DRAFT_7036 [Phyllosticta capitalensis]|uniref:Uncharacterized protein n=1 Tax=Phyllosticta capitalensis TaxID=121624 RepID=A0ABR1Z1J5_9PEZI
MAIEDFVAFEIGTFYSKDGKCKADADVAGIGVVVSFTAAAVLTTSLSICAALLDGLVDMDSAIPPKALHAISRRSLGRLITIERAKFGRQLLDRLMLALADQQLLTGIALLISGYIRARNPRLLNTEENSYIFLLWEPHFHLIIYLSCLASSSHLASVLTLKSYFASHSAVAQLRLVLIFIFAILLVASICFAFPFSLVYISRTLYSTSPIYLWVDIKYELCKIFPETCPSKAKTAWILISFYLVSGLVILYPFWISICQISPKIRESTTESMSRLWKSKNKLFPMYWIRCVSKSLRNRPGSSATARCLRAIPSRIKSALILLAFGTTAMAFYMQLLFASISLTYTMAQKFALAPDKLLNYLDEEVDWSTTKVCSLNVDEANTWNFGQMLPLILLFQFILAGMGAFYELRDESQHELPHARVPTELFPLASCERTSFETTRLESDGLHQEMVPLQTTSSFSSRSSLGADLASQSSLASGSDAKDVDSSRRRAGRRSTF